MIRKLYADLQPGDILLNDQRQRTGTVLRVVPASRDGYVIVMLREGNQISGHGRTVISVESHRQDAGLLLRELVRRAIAWAEDARGPVRVTGMRRNVRADPPDEYILRMEAQGTGTPFCIAFVRGAPGMTTFTLLPGEAFDANGLVDVGRPVWAELMRGSAV